MKFDTKRLTVRRMERMINERARASGIEGRVYPHMLRHSFATHLLRAGAHIPAIAEMMGHAKFSTTAQYAHVDLDHMRRALAHHPRA